MRDAADQILQLDKDLMDIAPNKPWTIKEQQNAATKTTNPRG
jgi:hypothetical protein